jgi:hypothetical protein
MFEVALLLIYMIIMDIRAPVLSFSVLGSWIQPSALSKSMNTTLPSTNGSTQPNGAFVSGRDAVRRAQTRDPLSATQDDGGQVKLALFGRPIPELLLYALVLYQAMENNEFFPDPQPPQDELAASLGEAKSADMEVMGLKIQLAAALSRRDTAIANLVSQSNKRGTYVQLASGGNSTRILSAGMDVRRPRRPVPELEVPTGLYVELSGTAGVATLTWDKVKHARMYMMEYGPVDGPYVQRPVPGQRKVILHDLPIGEMYQFRVRAMGGATGQSDWGPWAKRGIA